MLEVAAMARPHVAMLREKGVEPDALAQKISDVVKKAWENLEETPREGFSFFKPPVTVDEFTVELPDGRKRCRLNCILCEHVTSAPGDHQITNTKTGESFKFDDHNLHQIVNHYYFGSDRDYVNPVAASKVLGLL